MTSVLTPTTMTKNASVIIQTSTNLWEMYKEANRLLNYGVVIVTNGEVTDQAEFMTWLMNGGIPNWTDLATDFGVSSPEQAAQLFDLMGKTFGQINAETLNNEPNYLRIYMHKIG